MAGFSYSDIASLATPAGTIAFNQAAGDTLFLDPGRCSGLGTSRVRAPLDNKGQTDGYIVHDFFEEGQHLTLAGEVLIRSAVTEAGIVSARDALLADTRAKLRSILRADGTLGFASGGSLTVRCELLVEATSSDRGPLQKAFVLGLVSADPA
jgi:hypothetical protein